MNFRCCIWTVLFQRSSVLSSSSLFAFCSSTWTNDIDRREKQNKVSTSNIRTHWFSSTNTSRKVEEFTEAIENQDQFVRFCFTSRSDYQRRSTDHLQISGTAATWLIKTMLFLFSVVRIWSKWFVKMKVIPNLPFIFLLCQGSSHRKFHRCDHRLEQLRSNL